MMAIEGLYATPYLSKGATIYSAIEGSSDVGTRLLVVTRTRPQADNAPRASGDSIDATKEASANALYRFHQEQAGLCGRNRYRCQVAQVLECSCKATRPDDPHFLQSSPH